MSADAHNRDLASHPARDIDRVLRRRRATDQADQLDTTIVEPYVGIRTRHSDVVDVVRRRADGTLDMVRLTDDQAVLLGLVKPTWRMRIGAFLTKRRPW